MNQTAIIEPSRSGSKWIIHRGAGQFGFFSSLRWAIEWCKALDLSYVVLDKKGEEVVA